MAGGCRRGRHLLPGKSERGRTTVWLCTATFMYIYGHLITIYMSCTIVYPTHTTKSEVNVDFCPRGAATCGLPST